MCVSWWSVGTTDKTTRVLCGSSGCMEQSVSELTDCINTGDFQKPTRDILVCQRISTVSQSTSSEVRTVVILVMLRRLIPGFVSGGFWPMVNFRRSTPCTEPPIVHKMYDSWAHGHPAVVMWRYSREIGNVFTTVCRQSLAITTLVSSSNCFYGRPCVRVEGRYMLRVFFRTSSLEVTEWNSNQNLPHVYGCEPDMKTNFQNLRCLSPETWGLKEKKLHCFLVIIW